MDKAGSVSQAPVVGLWGKEGGGKELEMGGHVVQLSDENGPRSSCWLEEGTSKRYMG